VRHCCVCGNDGGCRDVYRSNFGYREGDVEYVIVGIEVPAPLSTWGTAGLR
jgi:hypothetical protein